MGRFAFVATLCMLSLLVLGSGCSANKPGGLNKPPKGFAALFNGKDLTGWRGLVANPKARMEMEATELAKAQAEADKLMREHWSVEDGVLVFDGKGSHLCTIKDYRDFEMYVDWKIPRNGDSGIYLRGSPQVQIWDPFTGTAGGHEKGSGGLYNNQKNPSAPTVRADNPIGEWNTFYIKMVGERVTVDLNGKRVADNVVLENYWEPDRPIYPCDQIEIQAHGSRLDCRNIFLREIPRRPDAATQQRLQAAKWRNLLGGKDLEGWEVVDGKPEAWVAEERVLATTGNEGGWLSTDREYADFQLELEFRVPPGGNSGVFLRAPRGGNPAFAGMEIQILDDYADQYANLKAYQYCGSLYATEPARPRAAKPAGEWQKMEILCVGRRVMVRVNGALVVDANLDDYAKLFEGHPGLRRAKGYIGLQSHGSRLEFRKIRIKDLTE